MLTELLFVNNNKFSGFGTFGESIVTNCNCYTGQAVKNADGTCSCVGEMSTVTPPIPPKVLDVFPNFFKNRLGVSKDAFINAIQITPISNGTTQDKITNWIKDNPLLAAGGLAGVIGLGYFFLKDK